MAEAAISSAVQHHQEEKGEPFLSSSCRNPCYSPARRYHHAPRKAIPLSAAQMFCKDKALVVQPLDGPSYSRAFLSLRKFYVSTQDALRRNGFKCVFNTECRLKSSAAGRREGHFVCSVPCPVWEDVACPLQGAFLVFLGTGLKQQTPGCGTSWQAFFNTMDLFSWKSGTCDTSKQSPAVAQRTVVCALLRQASTRPSPAPRRVLVLRTLTPRRGLVPARRG